MNTPTSQPEEYDVVVLGSGEAGKYIAWTMAKEGKRTVLIERKYVGGSPQHRMSSEQEYHSEREAGLVLLEERGVRNN